MPTVIAKRIDDIVVLTLDNPPVNALGAALRADLLSAVQEADGDPAVRGIVLASRGRMFSAGADISEFGEPIEAPDLLELCDAMEASVKPVVAAIKGAALGGGLELALACRYRVAAQSAGLGLPEVKLGLIPGAGGTQRLPHLVGIEAALAIIVGGNPVSASDAAKIGLVDAVFSDASLEQDAIAFARTLPTAALARETRVGADDGGLIEEYRRKNAKRIRGIDAPQAALEAIAAAIDLPLDRGLEKEAELFAGLLAGDQSRALRYMFGAERAAGKIDDLPSTTPLRSFSTVGIIGAGTMGTGIAINFLSAGISVTMVERDPSALARGIEIINRHYDAEVAKGRLTSDQGTSAREKLVAADSLADLSHVDLVIEAVFEQMEIKLDLFAQLDKICKPGAILASNTSFLDLDAMAAATSRPSDVVGLHFFSPANIMKLLEVVRGAKTSPTVLATTMAIARTIGKIAVVSGVCHGFIANRILMPRQVEAATLVLEGATPAQVDKVLVDFGFPMGPFQMSDLAGIDVGWDRESSNGATIRDVLCEMDRRGQKTLHGYYDYDVDRKGLPSSVVEGVIEDFASRQGISRRPIDDQEILERLLFPMVNEAAMILDEGVAQRASDIDVVCVNGFGWPRHTGGPMFWADTIGLNRIAKGLERQFPAAGESGFSRALFAKASKGGGFLS